MAIYIILFLISIATIIYFSFHLIYYALRIVFLLNSANELVNIDDVRNILSHKNRFYQQLPINKKSKFEKRVISFIDDMDFEGRNGLRVTLEMKVLISACAIQLTYGLSKYKFKNYITILVYPEEFYSQSIGRKVKGGVALSNVIALSWSDFVKGYQIEDDNFNLGLHEMTHALKCEAIVAGYSSIKFRSRLRAWLRKAESQMEKIKKDDQNYLRKYGTTNSDEFFSVCVEYFFETPKEFIEKYPELYNDISILLNIDPLNHHEGFVRTKKIGAFQFVKEYFDLFHFKDLENEWIFFGIKVIGVCLTVFNIILSHILITPMDLLIIYLPSFLLFFVFVSFFLRRGFSFLNFSLINATIFSPMLVTTILLVNMAKKSPEIEYINSNVKNQTEGLSDPRNESYLRYENEKLNQCLASGMFFHDPDYAIVCDSISFQYQKGLLGIPIVNEIRMYSFLYSNKKRLKRYEHIYGQ